MLEKLSKEDVDWIKDEIEKSTIKGVSEAMSSIMVSVILWIAAGYIITKIIDLIFHWSF